MVVDCLQAEDKEYENFKRSLGMKSSSFTNKKNEENLAHHFEEFVNSTEDFAFRVVNSHDLKDQITKITED